MELPAFPGDQIDPARSGGDLCIQACANDPQVAVHAVRNLVRLGVAWSVLVEPWDTSTLDDQEKTIGRSKGVGAPLGQRREFDPVDLTTHVDGEPAIPPTSHVALANPQNSKTAILRRGYSFVDGSDGLGRLDAGLFFISYQRDPETGFLQVQRNLRTDDMNEYIRHTSSALFACPPGVRGDDDWWGRTLFGA